MTLGIALLIVRICYLVITPMLIGIALLFVLFLYYNP